MFFQIFFPRSPKSPKLSAKSRSRGFAVLQFLEIVDEIEVRKLRGASDLLPRSSKSLKLSAKSRSRGFAVLQFFEIDDEIEVRKLRGAPDL